MHVSSAIRTYNASKQRWRFSRIPAFLFSSPEREVGLRFPPFLLLSETNRLLDSPGELLCERVVGLVRRQVQTVEARMRLGELGFFAGLLDREATGSVGSLKILETVDGDTRSTGGELQEAGFLLGIPAADDL